MLRGAFFSTHQTWTDRDAFRLPRLPGSVETYRAIGVTLVVVWCTAVTTALAVHSYDQNRLAPEIAVAKAKAELAHVEAQRRIAEQNLKYEMMRYEQELARNNIR